MATPLILNLGELTGAANDAYGVYQNLINGAELLPSTGYPENVMTQHFLLNSSR